jgi:hypothetical protein
MADESKTETRRDWDVVQENAADVTERLRVPGGWLYRTVTKSGAAALCFVPGAGPAAATP